MTIDKLEQLCQGNLNLMAWACGVQERQMREYLKKRELPPQRAALAELRTQEKRFKAIRKANRETS